MSDNAMVYWNEGLKKIVYRASSLGACDRALVAARLGYDAAPPPENLQKVYDAGHEAEDSIRLQLRIPNSQTEVRLDVPVLNCMVIGHVDGIREDSVIEVKSQSDAEYDKWQLFSWVTDPLWMKYAWQVSAYMIAEGKVLDVVRVKRSNPREFKLEHYRLPFHTREEIFQRIQHIESLAAAESLPDCTTTNTYGCPYYQYHESPELVIDEELDDACSLYKNAKHKTQVSKAIEDNAKAYLVKVLRDRKEVETTGGWRVKYSTFEKGEYTVKARTETRLTVTEKEL